PATCEPATRSVPTVLLYASVGLEARSEAALTAPRRDASFSTRARRPSPSRIWNLSYRRERCCFTAASVTTSSAAICRTDAGSRDTAGGAGGAQQGNKHHCVPRAR